MNDRLDQRGNPELEVKPGAEMNVGDMIIDALNDFSDALERGDLKRLTCRKVRIKLKPQQYDPAKVKETRELLNLSQVLFANFLGASPKTIRAWEQGTLPPNKMACRFMDEIRCNPEFWQKRVREELMEVG